MTKHYTISDIVTNLYKKKINKLVTIKGWVKYYRNNLFLDINDGSTIKNIQVVIKGEKYLKIRKKIYIGIPLKIIGKLVYQKKNTKNIEIIPKLIKLYKGCDIEYINNSILQNKYHKISKLREQVYLRFRTNIFSTIIRLRSLIFFEIHKFFQTKKYVYINTPIIGKNNAEGGGEVFKVTSLNYLDKNINIKEDILNNKARLTVSGQLELESAMYGLGKVYTFGPVFRADNSNTNKHLSEFWMLEAEIMYGRLKDIIKVSIELIKFIIKKILEKSNDDLIFLEKYHKKNNNFYDLRIRLNNIIKNKFIIIKYSKIIKLLKKIDPKIINWGDDIGSNHEKIIFDKIFINNIPVVVYNYPRTLKPFYMKGNKNNLTTKCIDILLPLVGEVVGGSERETSYKKLFNRIKKQNMDIKDFEWYINLRKLGEIYHSGFGLGVDRLIQFITGIKNIRDVVPFPIYPYHI